MSAHPSKHPLGGAACADDPPAPNQQYARQLSNDALVDRLDRASDLLQLHARIRIAIDGDERELTSVHQLPEEMFEIVGIDFSQSNSLTNESMNQLRGLREVRELNLSGAPITGTGALRGMSKLQSLWLDRTQVKGIGLLQVRHLQSLTRLSISGVEARDDEIRAIREALPGCFIQR